MKTVSILIPSRFAGKPGASDGTPLIFDAIESIRSQSIASQLALQIIVGVDSGANVPPALAATPGVRVAESQQRSQAAALNAAARSIDGDIVAILEDDDRWQPRFLEHAVAALESTAFVSSTQLETFHDGRILGINDFPTPSGWVMRRDTWNSVGPFDEGFRWHLDNDWLGRLTEKRHRRTHLIEATAPTSDDKIQAWRPWLFECQKAAGELLRLVRHDSPWPLVTRLVHPESGLYRIARNKTLTEQSRSEGLSIMQRYGRIPW